MKNLLILLICLTLFTTCKKYPEGGFVNRGSENIIGTWKLTLYQVNGIDSTELINYNADDGYKNNNFIKHHPKDKEIFTGKGEATLIDGNKNIEFCSTSVPVCNGRPCYRNYFVPEGSCISWEILKLKKNEFVLKSYYKNSYLLKLRK